MSATLAPSGVSPRADTRCANSGACRVCGGGGVDLASIAGQLVGGGVSGAIVTVIVGMILNAMNKR